MTAAWIVAVLVVAGLAFGLGADVRSWRARPERGPHSQRMAEQLPPPSLGPRCPHGRLIPVDDCEFCRMPPPEPEAAWYDVGAYATYATIEAPSPQSMADGPLWAPEPYPIISEGFPGSVARESETFTAWHEEGERFQRLQPIVQTRVVSPLPIPDVVDHLAVAAQEVWIWSDMREDLRPQAVDAIHDLGIALDRYEAWQG